MEEELEIRISYDKVWRARETVFHSIRSTPEESYQTLPLWWSMLVANNPSTITCIETDDEICFLYFFMVLGQTIARFKRLGLL